MEKCANTEMLFKKLSKEEQEERDYEFFCDDTDLLFNEIDITIKRIREIASQYDLDLEEDIREKVCSNF